MKIALLTSLTLAIFVSFSNSCNAQDAFDSVAAMGNQTNNTGNFTGSQSQQVGVYTGPQSPQDGAASGGDIFDPEVDSPPMLQGATNGTIGPSTKDGVFSDAPLTEKEIKLRDELIKIVACDEPNTPGLFPPLPQFPALPEYELEQEARSSIHAVERLSKTSYEHALHFAEKKNFQKAGDLFADALLYTTDEIKVRNLIRDELRKIADKFGKHKQIEEQINCLRLAVFFNHLDSGLQGSLNQCIKESGNDSSDASYRASLAEQFEELGDYRLASAEWRVVVKLKHSIENQLKLSAALSASGNDKEALFILKRILKGDWPDANKLTQARCHLALAQIFLKYYQVYNSRGAGASGIAILENAILESRRAITLNPRDKVAQKLFLDLSKKVVALRPTEAANHFLLAAAYVISGDNAKANEEYESCKALEPNDDRLPQAKLVMETVKANPSALLNGQIGEGIVKVQGMLDAEPRNVQLWRLLGRMYDQSADPEKAKACFKKADEVYFSPQ
ncbi:MAG: hypothetical protein K2X77_30955 [Candidatus Obscuribacterales bacterium]|jgi:tetratricopeptide (TPR) repeat protein|nr:hypothetical protein [Candidatus Obscuribacterales bacterium]